jgi:ABC-type bacteriocin/lantibiotic exporter with double-glycine peptidase domain
MLAPAATFGIYAIQAAIRGSESLNTVQAFTSLALISLVSHPASRLLSAIPNTAASIGCFDRIQAFLLAESHCESRKIAAEGYSSFNMSLSTPQQQALTSTAITGTKIQRHESRAITIQNANIRPSKTADFVLKDVDLSIEKGHLAILSGVVGAGKTTLLKAILGEIECSVGAIIVADKNIAYCSQSPWLINGSIKQAICGFKKEIDETWYQTVLTACELKYDISKLPAGDHTIIGSRGVALSGGQKQRITIARAIYAKSKILVLDDVLSSLDKQTESTVVSQLFGREGGFGIGLLRKSGCTTILVTHSSELSLDSRYLCI